MIVRSALLLGTVAPEDRPAFDAYMCDVVVGAIRTYPGIRSVTLRRHLDADTGASPIYMQFDLLFESVEAMDAALASDTRTIVRDRIKAGMGAFDGTVVHHVFSVLSGDVADQIGMRRGTLPGP